MNVVMADPHTANILTAGAVSAGVSSYIQTQATAFVNTISGLGSKIHSAVESISDRFYSDEAMRRISALRNITSNIFTEDTIRQLTTIAQVQAAKTSMQQYIVSEQNTAALIVAGDIGSYGIYDDMSEVEFNLFTRHKQNRVNHGRGVIVDEKMTYTSYTQYEAPEFVPLTHQEQINISNTWNMLALHYDSDDDCLVSPTSLMNDLIT